MWPVALSGRLSVEALVGNYPTNKLIERDTIPYRRNFPTPSCDNVEHQALPPVSRSYSRVQGRFVTHYSPVRRSHQSASTLDPARLACVKHAASARPEPESNSPPKNKAENPKTSPQKNINETNTPNTQRHPTHQKRTKESDTQPPNKGSQASHWH
jgi:hypothetical protein